MILLYSATLCLGAALLFLVEPMMGKALLPVLGGAPEVWITTQLFFQMTLLAGYGYAHLSGARLTLRRQAGLHLGLLALALALVPIGVHPGGRGQIDHPVLWVLGTLAVSVGLPFLLIAANGPLLQSWIAGARHRVAADPYFLYVASNVGSIAGLLAYPVVVEPELSLDAQARAWAWGYRVLPIMVCVCALAAWRARRALAPTAYGPVVGRAGEGTDAPAVDQADEATGSSPAIAGEEQPRDEPAALLSWRRRGRWLALAFVPSSFMLGTTTFITRDLAPVPLLWVIPLALYLGSLAIAFAPRHDSGRLVGVTRLVLPGVVVGLVYTMTIGSQRPLWLLLALHLAGLLVAALMCHGALAGDRPAVRHLTEFYLWVALGGALGGAFNALVAPLVFRSLAEYPLAIVAASLLRPPVPPSRPSLLEALGVDRRIAPLVDLTLPALFGLGLAAALHATATAGGDAVARRSVIIGFAAGLSVNFARRPVRFAAAVAVMFLATSLVTGGATRSLARERTFFGIYEVRSDDRGYHSLYDGTTLHGVQRLGGAGSPVPLSYYNPSGPAAQVFAELPDRGLTDRTAVVGLGSGAMACYSRPGQQWTFYEIDPAVVRIAENPRLFTYLHNCKGRFQVVVGDARRSLTLARDERYGIIVLDAFSSDAIPVHLLTREALTLYLARLTPRGLLLFHISNRYLDLGRELGALAFEQGLTCRVERARVSPAQADQRYAESTWLVMARRPADLGGVSGDPRWSACSGHAGQGWSDGQSSLLGLLRWG